MGSMHCAGAAVLLLSAALTPSGLAPCLAAERNPDNNVPLMPAPVQATPIVNGHRVQPRAADFAAPNRPDIGEADAKALEELYRKQMAPR